MTPADGTFVATDEVDSLRRVTPELAASTQTYDRDREFVAGFAAAAPGGVTVLVSQGGVVADLVGTLAELLGVRLGRRAGQKIPARKGSTWALSFVDSRMVAADYYPDLARAAQVTS